MLLDVTVGKLPKCYDEEKSFNFWFFEFLHLLWQELNVLLLSL